MRRYCKWILLPAILLVVCLAVPEKADATGWRFSFGSGHHGHSSYSHSGHGYSRSYTPYYSPSHRVHYDVYRHYDHYDVVPHVTHHGHYSHGRSHGVRRSYGHHGFFGH